MKTKRWSRHPTQAELASFTGMHCSKLYAWALASQWRCPSCTRTAQELVRWSDIRGPSFRNRYGDEYGMGFTVTMAKHHCHGSGRFLETVICGDCNSADGAAKRKLKLPEAWSFTPEEIAQFVSVKPHSGATLIDYEKAEEIYRSASSARVRLGKFF